MTDPISDLLTAVRNAYLAKKDVAVISHSNIKANICQILTDTHYIKSFKVTSIDKTKKNLEMTMNYLPSGSPILTGIKKISKPSVRRFSKKGEFPRSLSGAGISIISTSKGIMTDKQARAAGLGGEVICQVW